jgi:solute carrier family 25 thiamine pyrophosphate transporter 19
MINCFSQIIRKEGLIGLYKGIAPSLLKAYLSTAMILSIYDSVCHRLRQRSSD